MKNSALVVGATGLIGKQVVDLLLSEASYERVISITRKPLLQHHSKYENVVIDFNDIQSYADSLKANHVFCCLGTTMKNAGSKEKFRKVDFEYPLEIAEITKKTGAQCFLLVSSMGADKNSSFFYNQVKGEIEESISKVGFDSYHIFRPSLLVGPRAEKRMGERLAQVFMGGLSFLFIGPLKKYKAIQSSKVAQAMVQMALQGEKGKFIHESDRLQQF